jgi:hypothetical protein
VPEPREPYGWVPLWITLSGLPRHLCQKIRNGHGWAVLRTILELDCQQNRTPDVVEIPLTDLADLAGLEAPAVRKAILALRKLRIIACFLPETDEEAALLKVRTPLWTPISPDELCQRHPAQFSTDGYFRYAQALDEAPGNEAAPAFMQEVVDLYFNTIGMKMNAFVLDELRLLVERFSPEEIRSAFRRAQRNEIRSLGWIAGQLAKARSLASKSKQVPRNCPE